jgi:hypothetical protein
MSQLISKFNNDKPTSNENSINFSIFLIVVEISTVSFKIFSITFNLIFSFEKLYVKDWLNKTFDEQVQ